MIRFLFLPIAIVIALYSSSQAQKIDESNLQKANELSGLYKDEEVVLLKNITTLNFEIDSKTRQVSVKEEEEYDYLALKNNAEMIKKIFFNDHTSIVSYSLQNEKGKYYAHDKFCGHIEDKGIFYSDMQMCAYDFIMDQRGRLINLRSEMTYDDPRYLTHIFFQEDVTVEYREISINIPSSVEVELLEMNFENYDIQKEVINHSGPKPYTTYQYLIKKIEAFPKEEHTPGYAHFLPHLLVLTKSYTIDNEKITVLSSTGDLYKWYSSLVSNVDKRNDSLKEKVKELTDNQSTNEEKIKSIYYWVQDNIKYIAFEDGVAAYQPESAEKVYYNRYGDCKGMANLIKNMLQIAGYDARLAWIGTNKIPYTYDIPSLAVDNHMICYLLMDDKHYLLDPTEKYNPFALNAERIQGKQVLVEDGEKYIIYSVPVEPLEKYLEDYHVTFNISENQLQGHGASIYKGEQKKILLNIYHSIETDETEKFMKYLVSGKSNPDDVKIKSHSAFAREEPLEINYDISLPNQMNIFDNQMYLDMDFSKDLMGQEIEDDRKSPYFFESKVFKKISAELPLPNGYRLEYLPEPYLVENEYFKFNLKYELKQNKLFYTKEIRIFQNILPKSQFKIWNEAINKLNDFYNNQIILQTHED